MNFQEKPEESMHLTALTLREFLEGGSPGPNLMLRRGKKILKSKSCTPFFLAVLPSSFLDCSQGLDLLLNEQPPFTNMHALQYERNHLSLAPLSI